MKGAHNPRPPILDNYNTTGRKLNTGGKPFWYDLTPEEKRKKKFNRAFQRFMLGISMPGEYRLLTLTTPPEFKGDLHTAFRNFIKRMRREGLAREYFAVKEWNKQHTCQHLHVVLRLDYIQYQLARKHWRAVTGAVWIHVDKVKSTKGMANYLGKYLNKAWDDEPGKRSYWYAYEWIYRKWRGFSKVMYKVGEPVSVYEHQLVHEIKDREKRLEYMNHRIVEATLSAVRQGLSVTELEIFLKP